MIKVKYGDVFQVFVPINGERHAVDCMRSLKDLAGATYVKLSRLCKELLDEAGHIDLARKAIIDRHVVKDEDGAPKIEDGNYVVIDQGAFDKEIEELFDHEIELKSDKIVFPKDIKFPNIECTEILDPFIEIKEK